MKSRVTLLVTLGLGAAAVCAASCAAPGLRASAPRLLPERAAREEAAAHAPDSAVVALHAEGDRLRWVRAAELVLDGNLSCVDGRASDGVLGTPGGDAGELLLALASVERLSGVALAPAEIDDAVDHYLHELGRFYMHTDREAVAHLEAALRDDPRFAGVDVSDGEALIRRPPEAVRAALLEHLLEPEAIGCGHLRLLTLHPEEYGVRPELTRRFLGAVFERLWRPESPIDFVVLDGVHEERAVVDVVLGHPVHAHTAVPAIPPTAAGTQVFVHHPEAAHFLRQEIASFLVESSPALHARVPDVDALVAVEEQLGQRQLEATLGHLAPDLPVYELRFRDGAVDVRAR